MAKKKIKDLPPSERPQEKLFQKGQAALSDEELLAILLGTGSKKHNALTLAQTILKKIPLEELNSKEVEQIKISGVGKTKSARIQAALALGERLFAKPLLHITHIQSVQDVLREVTDMGQKKQEHMVVLYMNARNELIKKETIAIGNVNVLGIEIKEIFAPALLTPCTSIAVVHNHPSGDPAPSDADILFTKRLHEAGKLLGVILYDHVIVAESSYFSFAEGK